MHNHSSNQKYIIKHWKSFSASAILFKSISGCSVNYHAKSVGINCSYKTRQTDLPTTVLPPDSSNPTMVLKTTAEKGLY